MFHKMGLFPLNLKWYFTLQKKYIDCQTYKLKSKEATTHMCAYTHTQYVSVIFPKHCLFPCLYHYVLISFI